MGWFSNNKEKSSFDKIPELPELPEPATSLTLPSLEENTLPPLPMSPVQLPELTKDFSEEDTGKFINEPKPGMQKSKFSDFPPMISTHNQTSNNPEHSGIPKPIREIKHMESFNYHEQQKNHEFYKPPVPATKSLIRKNEPVYIRLDKFQATMETFREIRSKIREIEEILIRTKEIKAREEKELEEWEREIESIKLKIDSMDKNISNPGE